MTNKALSDYQTIWQCLACISIKRLKCRYFCVTVHSVHSNTLRDAIACKSNFAEYGLWTVTFLSLTFRYFTCLLDKVHIKKHIGSFNKFYRVLLLGIIPADSENLVVLHRETETFSPSLQTIQQSSHLGFLLPSPFRMLYAEADRQPQHGTNLPACVV